MLFVREKSEDEYGKALGYVFVGEAIYLEHYGSKPMSITWQLLTPMPHYLWSDSAKLRIG
jgi:hypothetical protein